MPSGAVDRCAQLSINPCLLRDTFVRWLSAVSFVVSQEEYDRVCALDPIADALTQLLTDSGLCAAVPQLSEGAAAAVVTAIAAQLAAMLEGQLLAKSVRVASCVPADACGFPVCWMRHPRGSVHPLRCHNP